MYRAADSDDEQGQMPTVQRHPKDLDQTQSVSTWKGKPPYTASS